MPKNFFGTSYCLCAISYAREGKSPPGTKRLLTLFSHVQENCSAYDYKASTIASIVFNSIYDSSLLSFFFLLTATITRHATTPTPSSVMPMAIGTSY